MSYDKFTCCTLAFGKVQILVQILPRLYEIKLYEMKGNLTVI